MARNSERYFSRFRFQSPSVAIKCLKISVSGPHLSSRGKLCGTAAGRVVPAEYQISGTSGKVEVLSSDGIARVKLRSFIHFNQNQIGSLAPTDSKWSMDERTDMVCEIKDGDMQVSATFTQTSDGTECFKGTWHTRFVRFDN